MPVSVNTMRLTILLCLFGMQLLAAFYLRRRRLSVVEYFGWGMLVALVPALGPFLAILLKPGRPAITTRRQRGRSMQVSTTPADFIRQLALRIRLTKP